MLISVTSSQQVARARSLVANVARCQALRKIDHIRTEHPISYLQSCHRLQAKRHFLSAKMSNVGRFGRILALLQPSQRGPTDLLRSLRRPFLIFETSSCFSSACNPLRILFRQPFNSNHICSHREYHYQFILFPCHIHAMHINQYTLSLVHLIRKKITLYASNAFHIMLCFGTFAKACFPSIACSS